MRTHRRNDELLEEFGRIKRDAERAAYDAKAREELLVEAMEDIIEDAEGLGAEFWASRALTRLEVFKVRQRES